MSPGVFRNSFYIVAAAVCLCAPASSFPEGLPTTPPLRQELVAIGAQLYTRCVSCHGPDVVASGAATDLRTSTSALAAVAFASIVRGGALQNQGMPGFPELTNRELEGLRYYIRSRAAAK